MSVPPGPPPRDLLVSGEDRPRRSWGAWHRRSALVAAVVAVAVGAGILVGQDRARDERRRVAAAEQDVVRLALLEAGQDGAPRYGPRRPGIHLVVANDGPVPVRLQSGTLVPGDWQVAVPAGRALRPGRSVLVELRPPAACGTAEPSLLRLQALPPSGRPTRVTFDLAQAELAYGGTLADAVAAASLVCDLASAADDRTQPQGVEEARPSR